jgi:hypothetical protein
VPGFTLQLIDDEILLYHAGLTRTVHLNPTASLIWQLCTGDRSAETIATLVADAYPDGGPEVRADVHATLDRLSRDGVIEWQ